MSTSPGSEPGAVAIRRSDGPDQPALARLAELDSAPRPIGPHLLVEEDGVVRAALPLDGGPSIADPFHRTAELVALLELRMRQLSSESARDREARHGSGARARGRAPRRFAFAVAPPRR